MTVGGVDSVPVVKVHVWLVTVEVPSSTVAYHSYCLLLVRFSQSMLAVEPEGTVTLPMG